MKRIFDITASLIGLILLSPFLIAISFFISLTMPGPILFRQQRVGKNRRIFNLNKFRSMSVKKGSEKGHFDIGDKSRITKLGRILRKFKLDELPQLFNVLVGDMSLVGPRPEVQKWTDVYPEKWDTVLKVRPGITDNASIVFRNEEEILANSTNPEQTYEFEILPKKLDYYIDYVNNNSFRGDITIIFRTFYKIIA
jgi:lipopolysaccharide/colanic/teichoic acid biosynthesis glycosyltransferase